MRVRRPRIRLFAAAALVVGTTLLAACGTLWPAPAKPAPIPDVSRPTLYEIRRGPQQQVIAGVWTPDGLGGQVVFNPATWPMQPGDVWFDTGLESPPAGDMCTEYMPKLGGQGVTWAEWTGEVNNISNQIPCGPPMPEEPAK